MDQADEDLLLEHQLCFALSVASRSVVGAYKPVLENLGLTHPQYLVMLALWEHSPRSVRSLGTALAMDPATLSPMLKRLEAAGLVTRDRAPGDDRSLAVALTEAGRDLRRDAAEIPATMMGMLGLTRGQVQELNAAMRRLIAAAQAAPAGTGSAG